MLSLAVKNENDKAYDVYLKEMEPQRETVNQLIEDIQTLNADNAKTIYQRDSKEAGSIITLLIIVIAKIACFIHLDRTLNDKADHKADQRHSGAVRRNRARRFYCQRNISIEG